MESLDISYLTDLFYPYLLGGGERQFYEIARRMAKRHNVEVITLRIRGAPDREWHEGMEIRRIGIPHPRRGRDFLRLAGMLPAFLKTSQIVHANQGVSAIRGIRGGFVTIHDLYFGDWHRYYPLHIALAGRLLEKANTLGNAHYITVSSWSREKLLAAGISRERISVVPNGIDVSKYRRARKQKTILYVGRIVKYKRVEELIQAYLSFSKEHPEYSLKIIGDGPLRERLENAYPDIEFLGFVDEETKIRELAKAEIFANPSEIEGFGIAALEAMASGCKIVLKPLPCYEFARGAIFTTDFRKGLERAAEMGAPSYDVSAFDWNSIVRRLERLYLSEL